MTPDQQLTELFSSLEKAERPVRVSFADGEIYDLQILSTSHAEAGGDIVADVVASVETDGAACWETAFMNFKARDVVRVEAGNECLFARVDG